MKSLNGIQTHDTGVVLSQLSYQANWELVTLSVGLIAQLEQHCTGIAKIMGLNLFWA